MFSITPRSHGRPAHSHSMVLGGFVETSYTTRFMPFTSFIIL